MGNLHSVYKKLNNLQINPIISSDPKLIEKADKILLPGVGHFKRAMENLRTQNFFDVLNEAVLIKKKPVLGICLGMQLMANKSEEGNVNGFGWIDADVVRFCIKDKIKYKIPHMGWNQISQIKESKLMKGVPDFTEFYFVHSFHYKCNDFSVILNETEYEYKFTSAIEKENIFGVQYHPEKSHNVGDLLLKNFINL